MEDIKGVWVVEFYSDYKTQMVAYKTKEECYKYIDKLKKTNDYFKNKIMYITFYEFGQDFDCD